MLKRDSEEVQCERRFYGPRRGSRSYNRRASLVASIISNEWMRTSMTVQTIVPEDGMRPVSCGVESLCRGAGRKLAHDLQNELKIQ